MDPILEEMQRAKDVQIGRFRTWTTYLIALVAAKDDEIAALKARMDALESSLTVQGHRRG